MANSSWPLLSVLEVVQGSVTATRSKLVVSSSWMEQAELWAGGWLSVANADAAASHISSRESQKQNRTLFSGLSLHDT